MTARLTGGGKDVTEKPKHPNDMTRKELREMVFDMSWLALNLAQHLDFTTFHLKEEFRPAAYERACQMAYELSDFPYDGRQLPEGRCQVAFFGEKGLEVHGIVK